MRSETEPRNDSILYGRNPVLEALKAGTRIDTVYTSIKDSDPFFKMLWALCKEQRAVFKQVDNKKLDSLTGGGAHQGVAAAAAQFQYSELSEILDAAKQKNEPLFLLAADGIEDPHNLGAIIRTAECAGVHGIIIGQRRSVSVNATVMKASAGAASYMKIARVVNISAALDAMKEKGIFVYGAHMEGQPYGKTDFSGNICLVIGSEGEGLSRLVKEKCDVLVSLPQRGQINSLNASVAAGILLYEALKSRI